MLKDNIDAFFAILICNRYTHDLTTFITLKNNKYESIAFHKILRMIIEQVTNLL